MTGQPGDGCDDPRPFHIHWCGFCGAELIFSSLECGLLVFVPPCLRCRERQWRDEIDLLTAPDHREL